MPLSVFSLLSYHSFGLKIMSYFDYARYDNEFILNFFELMPAGLDFFSIINQNFIASLKRMLYIQTHGFESIN